MSVPAAAPEAPAQDEPAPLRHVINRCAKRGHAALGGAFVLLLCLHLFAHRRHLLQ